MFYTLLHIVINTSGGILNICILYMDVCLKYNIIIIIIIVITDRILGRLLKSLILYLDVTLT